MNAFFFFLLFRFYFNSLKVANIGERPNGVLETASKFRLREEIEFAPVFTPYKQRRKRKFNVVFVQVVKKSVLHVQNVLFFIYLSGWFRLTFSFPSLSSCSESKRFGKNACHLLTRYICHSSFGSSVNYFVSLETNIWVERKKTIPCFRKNI